MHVCVVHTTCICGPVVLYYDVSLSIQVYPWKSTIASISVNKYTDTQYMHKHTFHMRHNRHNIYGHTIY